MKITFASRGCTKILLSSRRVSFFHRDALAGPMFALGKIEIFDHPIDSAKLNLIGEAIEDSRLSVFHGFIRRFLTKFS